MYTMTEETGMSVEGMKQDDKVSKETADDKGDKIESAEVVYKILPYMGITKPLGAHLMVSMKEKI